jgi:hypothetical protein
MSAAGAAVLRRLEKVGGRRAAARLCSVDALGPRAAAGGHLLAPSCAFGWKRATAVGSLAAAELPQSRQIEPAGRSRAAFAAAGRWPLGSCTKTP